MRVAPAALIALLLSSAALAQVNRPALEQEVPVGHLEKQAMALAATSLQPPLTDEEKRQLETIRMGGSRDPKIATDGVINYMFTFGSGFHVLFADCPGPITDGQKLVELVKGFKPSTVFLGHHDGPGVAMWAANYPAALAIRKASPKTRTMEVIYRTPVCFNTASKEMVIGW